MLRKACFASTVLVVATVCGQAGAKVYRHRFKLVETVGMGDELLTFGMSHRDPNFVMIGTSTGKLHRTTDGGVTWREITVTPFRSMFFGRERHADPSLEYALGLPGKSPHLQNWLRQKGLHTSGINLQQLLVRKGDKSVAIHWIEVDWHDENRVYLGTNDGLYRSVDKGRNFIRIWQGRAGLAERTINTVATDPNNRKRLLIGTASGLFISEDRGITFRKEMNFYIRGSYVRGLYYVGQDSSIVHMAMGGAAMGSPDGGKNWITTHWHLWHPRSRVNWISVGAGNLIAMATGDGVWASWQGGEMGTWQRRGYRLTGVNINKVLVTDDPKIWYALSDHSVFVTEDYGNSWHKIMQFAKGVPQWIHSFNHNRRDIWMITSRSVFRTGESSQYQGVRSKRGDPALLDVPDLFEFWYHVAAEHKRLYFSVRQGYRNRAPWAAFLPQLSLRASYDTDRENITIRAFPYLDFPFLNFYQIGDQALRFEVLVNWDFSRLIFDRRQLPRFGRIERTLNEIATDLKQRVYRMYGEYRRIAQELYARPPSNPLKYEFKRLRLLEIADFF